VSLQGREKTFEKKLKIFDDSLDDERSNNYFLFLLLLRSYFFQLFLKKEIETDDTLGGKLNLKPFLQ
jgi:hypothetical protein